VTSVGFGFSRTLGCLAASILLGSVAAACSSPPSSPSPPIPLDQLVGTWNLASLQPAREVEQAVASGAAYTLTFGIGNQFSTRGDCAACSGTFGVTGNTLTTGPLLVCTLIACRETDFDSRYKSLLTGASTVAVSATNLQLSSARGILRFTR